jgi:HK97 family phage prohead protease
MEYEIERRNIELTEFRLIAGNDAPKIVGHAAMFEKLSEDLGGFREKIAPGAFTNSLKKDDVRALFNHDANYVLGRNKAKTLTLKEDELGLYIEIDPPDTQWARDLQESIRRGDISQMSFGFVVNKDEWEHKKGKDSIRTLQEVKLFDVSPVTYPAYPQTSVKVRDYITALKETESKLLDEKGVLKEHTPSLTTLKWKLR